MNKLVLRTKKVKSMRSLRGRARHNAREIFCPNVDQSRSKLNGVVGAKTSDDVLARTREKINECKKRGQVIRSDAVLAVEYVLSASHEWWAKATAAEKKSFVKLSMEWLEEKHGKENIISAYWHRDEKTDHIHAFIVPVCPELKLNCKHYLGTPAKMRAMQTSFAKKMGVLGLERGMEGSKAHHQTLKEYGAMLNEPVPKPSKKDYLAASLGLKNETVEKVQQLAQQAKALSSKERALRAREAKLDKREIDLSRLASEAAMSSAARERMQKEIDQLKRDNEALRKKVGDYSPTMALSLN